MFKIMAKNHNLQHRHIIIIFSRTERLKERVTTKYLHNAHIISLTFLLNPGSEDDSSDMVGYDDEANSSIKGGDDGRHDSDIPSFKSWLEGV